jgi:aminoglycoside phosphotransferase family enzyme
MKKQWKDPWVELQKKVLFLKEASSYPIKTTKVECIETHMSWVFVTETEAYKLKKPVHFPFLNLEELEDRRVSSEREVFLNQELSPGLYLKTVPLLKKNNSYEISEEDTGREIVDWLVWMKVMPRQFTLDQEMKDNRVNKELLQKAAEILVGFYKKSPIYPLRSEDYKDGFESCIKENFKILSRIKYKLDTKFVSSLHEEQLNLLFSLSHQLERRVQEGRIIEVHGDLRPEHICLTDPPLLIDRLEFNDKMRMLDPLEELSYLSMECQLLGHPEVGDFFIDLYQNMTGDRPDRNLILFYKSYRALLRARICVLHFDDRRIINKDYYLRKATQYLNLGGIILEQHVGTFGGVQLLNLPPASVSAP